MSGQLFLDRVPRAAYLLPSTRETAAQRKQLMQILTSCSTATDFVTAARQSRDNYDAERKVA